MSTIGRIFLVLNLLFAGAFLAFAGAFLQEQDNYKQQYDASQEALSKSQKDEAQLRDDLKTVRNQLDVEKTNLQGQKVALERDVKKAQEENATLKQQLSELEANYKAMQSDTATMKTKIEGAFNQAQEAWSLALKSQEQKDNAVREKDQAQADLLSANNRIDSLENDKMGLLAKEAELQQEIREKDILISAARNNGFNALDVMPRMEGVVTQAEGDLVTVRVTDNPTKSDIKPGYKFAIYDNNRYKGDMTVTDVANDYAIGRVYLRQNNAVIEVGDRAATDLQVISAR